MLVHNLLQKQTVGGWRLRGVYLSHNKFETLNSHPLIEHWRNLSFTVGLDRADIQYLAYYRKSCFKYRAQGLQLQRNASQRRKTGSSKRCRSRCMQRGSERCRGVVAVTDSPFFDSNKTSYEGNKQPRTKYPGHTASLYVQPAIDHGLSA